MQLTRLRTGAVDGQNARPWVQFPDDAYSCCQPLFDFSLHGRLPIAGRANLQHGIGNDGNEAAYAPLRQALGGDKSPIRPDSGVRVAFDDESGLRSVALPQLVLAHIGSQFPGQVKRQCAVLFAGLRGHWVQLSSYEIVPPFRIELFKFLSGDWLWRKHGGHATLLLHALDTSIIPRSVYTKQMDELCR